MTRLELGSVESIDTTPQLVPLRSTSLLIPEDMDEEKPPATVKIQRHRRAVRTVGRIRSRQRLAILCQVHMSCERVHTAETGAGCPVD